MALEGARPSGGAPSGTACDALGLGPADPMVVRPARRRRRIRVVGLALVRPLAERRLPPRRRDRPRPARAERARAGGGGGSCGESSPGGSGVYSEWALAPAYLGFAVVAVALAWIDADVHRLPRGLTTPAYPMLLGQLALASLASGDWAHCGGRRSGGAALVPLPGWPCSPSLWERLGPRGRDAGRGSSGSPPATCRPWRRWWRRSPPSSSSGSTASRASCCAGGAHKDDIAFGPWMLVGCLLALLLGSRPCSDGCTARSQWRTRGLDAPEAGRPVRGRIRECCVG